MVLFRRAEAATPDSQVVQAFALSASPQATYARDREENAFYVQLNVTNLRTDLSGTRCVDPSFLTWIRRMFKKDTKTITLVATITGPQEGSANAKKVPLFEISYDDSKKPPTCLTDVVTSQAITLRYVATRIGAFHLDVQALTQQTANFSVASSVVATASSLLSFGAGSAWLISNMGKYNSQLNAATQAVDSSLSANWSQADQKTFHFDLNPWPTNGDWSRHLDTATFAVGNLVPAGARVVVDQTLLPTLAISLIYVDSIFGGGPGHYKDEDAILASKVTGPNMDTLDSVFALGLPGFSTAQALAIADSAAIGAFCTAMRTNFPNFLSSDDSLAAMHSVLLRRTNYYNSSSLHEAPQCLNAKELARLASLSSVFTIPLTDRLSFKDRSAFVTNRGSRLISPALAGVNKDLLTKILSDPATFIFAVSSEVSGLFPPSVDGKPWGGLVGDAAVDQLITAGGIRTACWQAIPNQNLRNMVGMALGKSTGKSAALFVEFDSDYRGGGNGAPDNGKVVKITFLPVSAIQGLVNLSSWPDDSCPLK